MMQEPRPGTAGIKRNSWRRGNGAYSFRGERKRGIAHNKKYLNRKVRRKHKMALSGGGYKKICKTLRMVEFS